MFSCGFLEWNLQASLDSDDAVSIHSSSTRVYHVLLFVVSISFNFCFCFIHRNARSVDVQAS